MTILLVEDDDSIALVITAALEAEGFAVSRCDTLAGRDRLLAQERFSALVTDVILPDGDGIETIGVVRQLQPGLPIIILSAQNTLDTAVRASDTGAFEYFPKPFDIDELARTVRQAVGSVSLIEEADDSPMGEGLPLVGRSAPMQAVYRMITRVLRNDLTVLILGESGTGKELVAEAIHQLGHRRDGPFVAVNTAAIPAELIESELFGHEKGAFTGAVARHIGKFEQAAGGTRLLRALQSGSIRRVGGREEVKIDARIVAATNRALEPLIAAEQFREDLFYRLNVVPINLPPLRERPDDIEALARHFLQLAAGEGLPRRQLAPDAADLLSRQPWRGNVRELKNFIYRLALLAREDVIDAEGLGPLLEQTRKSEAPVLAGSGFADAVAQWLRDERPLPGTIYDMALAAMERPLFCALLRETGGNQLRTAQLLGINRNTLRKRLADLGIDPEEIVRT
ncbi:MAG TPA: sigma-54 dependent transcriptional regulator [Novosphingobium sp.]|nr:sigma-54 dependent transcriptional regulator [Novosphingobium sp.]